MRIIWDSPFRWVLAFMPVVLIAVFILPLFVGFPSFNQATVPALTGKPSSQVIKDLRQANLHLGNEQFIPSSAEPGTIVDQYPSAGSHVDIGSQVEIVIAQHS